MVARWIFCVLRRQGQDFEVVATHGIGLGGDHLDQLLFRQLLFPHLGKGQSGAVEDLIAK